MDARQLKAVAFAKRWHAAPDNIDQYDAFITDAVAGERDLTDQQVRRYNRFGFHISASRFHRGHLDDGK